MSTSRRDFMKYACYSALAAAAATTATAAAFPDLAGAASAGTSAGSFNAVGGTALSQISFDECQSRTPLQMARDSKMIRNSWDYLQGRINSLSDTGLRSLVRNIYADTTPLLARPDTGQRREIWRALKATGYTTQSETDFLPPIPANMNGKYPAISAPGSGYGSHHAYPGGLITHVAANVSITENIVGAYVEVYGYRVDRDVALASQLLHDLHKPYVFQWQPNGSSRTEQQLAGTGEHHVLSLAELLVRKAPPALVVAQACAHTHPGTPQDEAQVVGWLKAAALIAGVDPAGYGLLDKSGKTLPLPRRQEGFICHLGDHDFVLSVPAVQWTLPVMREIAAKDYKLSAKDLEGKPFNSLRNQVYAELSAMRIENVYAEQGREAVRALMHAVVAPLS